MNRRKLIIGAVIALGVVAAVPLIWSQTALAHGDRGGFGFCRMRDGGPGFAHFRELTRDLNLTDEQKDQIHGIMRRTHEQAAANHDALKATFMDAAQVLLADPSNVADARAVLDRNAPTIEQVKTTVLGGVSEGLKVLTPEQRQKLSARLAEKRD